MLDFKTVKCKNGESIRTYVIEADDAHLGVIQCSHGAEGIKLLDECALH